MTLIEQLKDPKLAQSFGVYEKYFPEKAEIIKKAYPKGCRYFSSFSREWNDVPRGENPTQSDTYILKLDYQPEPEYVDLEIDLHEGWYGVWSPCKDDESITLPFRFTHLHCLPSLPGFFCFWQEENGEGYKDTEHISFEVVATAISPDNTVFARFRTGEK